MGVTGPGRAPPGSIPQSENQRAGKTAYHCRYSDLWIRALTSGPEHNPRVPSRMDVSRQISRCLAPVHPQFDRDTVAVAALGRISNHPGRCVGALCCGWLLGGSRNTKDVWRRIRRRRWHQRSLLRCRRQCGHFHLGRHSASRWNHPWSSFGRRLEGPTSWTGSHHSRFPCRTFPPL